MASTYVVIGTAPTADCTVAVGPFRSLQRASDAWDALTTLGYVAEMVTCQAVGNLAEAPDWSDNEGETTT